MRGIETERLGERRLVRRDAPGWRLTSITALSSSRLPQRQPDGQHEHGRDLVDVYALHDLGLDGDPLNYWTRIVSANLLGTMHVTRHAIEVLKKRGGAVVNVAASEALGFGEGDRPAWVAAKAGILRLTAALRGLAEQRIRVNCLAPERIDSPEDFARAAVDVALREDFAGRVLRFASGDPMTKKRHETLWKRIGQHVARM